MLVVNLEKPSPNADVQASASNPADPLKNSTKTSKAFCSDTNIEDDR